MNIPSNDDNAGVVRDQYRGPKQITKTALRNVMAGASEGQRGMKTADSGSMYRPRPQDSGPANVHRVNTITASSVDASVQQMKQEPINMVATRRTMGVEKSNVLKPSAHESSRYQDGEDSLRLRPQQRQAVQRLDTAMRGNRELGIQRTDDPWKTARERTESRRQSKRESRQKTHSLVHHESTGGYDADVQMRNDLDPDRRWAANRLDRTSTVKNGRVSGRDTGENDLVKHEQDGQTAYRLKHPEGSDAVWSGPGRDTDRVRYDMRHANTRPQKQEGHDNKKGKVWRSYESRISTVHDANPAEVNDYDHSEVKRPVITSRGGDTVGKATEFMTEDRNETVEVRKKRMSALLGMKRSTMKPDGTAVEDYTDILPEQEAGVTTKTRFVDRQNAGMSASASRNDNVDQAVVHRPGPIDRLQVKKQALRRALWYDRAKPLANAAD
jgi:hypothetical protein